MYMNPPYGSAIKLWIAKAYAEVIQGKAHMVIALVPARTDTQWWHNYVVNKATTYFFKGRLAFGDGKQAAPFPSVLVVWGGSERVLEQIAEALPMTWRR